jgi:ankyrin repeat protein
MPQKYLTLVISSCSALSRFVNKAADGGITALHIAALNGYFDCVQLLLDIHANVSSVTFHYGTTMDLIGLPFYSMPHNFIFSNL